jgi:hypothetical protein
MKRRSTHRCRPIPPQPLTIDQVLKQCVDANTALTLTLAQATAGMSQMARRLADVERRVAHLEEITEEM